MAAEKIYLSNLIAITIIAGRSYKRRADGIFSRDNILRFLYKMFKRKILRTTDNQLLTNKED
jgi:hypothetical protein